MTATEINMEKEISSLRKAGRDREQDLETLNSVLQCNQDLINVRMYTHTHLLTVVLCAVQKFTLRLHHDTPQI